MYRIPPGAYLVLALAAMAATKIVAIPVLIQMMVYSLSIIATSSHLSLILRNNDNQDEPHQGEILTKEESLKAPINASIMIFALYLAFQILPPNVVNLVISAFTCVVGLYSVTQTAAVALYYGVTSKVNRGPRLALKIPCLSRFEMHLSYANVLGSLISLCITFGWFVTHWWILHNLFAICISIQIIRSVSLGTFKVGAMLLLGLFVYDIFWVFGTGVMVKVATNVEAPAKLLFPVGGLGSTKMSLLGLGDIVIPGLFMAMTLRFDHWIHNKIKGKPEDIKENINWVNNITTTIFAQAFPKFYFKASLISYGLGLLITGLVLITCGKAQPALLYLVPCLLAGLYVPGIARGQLKLINEFEESQAEAEEEEEEEEED